ncbi:MAG: peptidylprolyl isomerase [Chloroflexi bacterium]|nr:peptidylprolyl isomerase [Chloroflexota bacterium]
MREKQARQNRMIMIIGGVLAVVVIGLIVWSLLPKPEAEPSVAGGSVTFGEAVVWERPLADLDPAERTDYYSESPPMILEEGVDYQARIITNKGEILLDLYEEETPLTVNNFVYLANQGFYDGIIFHRVLEDFMAQTGDPTGTGMGGPGYQFGDEVDAGFVFDKRGQLAMANSGPGTNGSQFFITFIPTDWLTGNHTIFGELLDGDDVLGSLSLRDPQAPSGEPDVMERIAILEN